MAENDIWFDMCWLLQACCKEQTTTDNDKVM